jgi:hypothetical protein
MMAERCALKRQAGAGFGELDAFRPEWDAMEFERNNPNAAVDWVAIMLRVGEFPDSNLDPQPGYHD